MHASSKRGVFVTLEGPEGAGKSTQAGLLAMALSSQGVPVEVTREPGGTPLGERIRELLLAASAAPMHASSELLLMLAARAEHWHTRIQPALLAGSWVVCDRYLDATLAYQGAGRGLDTNMILALHQQILGDCLPDCTLLLDLPSNERDLRRQQRGTTDRFEAEAVAFHERVSAAYAALPQRFPERVCVVPATGTPEQVQARVMSCLEPWLQQREAAR